MGHSTRQAGMAREQQQRTYIPIHKQQAQGESLGLTYAFDTPEPTPSCTPPPTRLHILTPPKQFHQLGIKHSNIWAYGGLTQTPATLSLSKLGVNDTDQ